MLHWLVSDIMGISEQKIEEEEFHISSLTNAAHTPCMKTLASSSQIVHRPAQTTDKGHTRKWKKKNIGLPERRLFVGFLLTLRVKHVVDFVINYVT